MASNPQSRQVKARLASSHQQRAPSVPSYRERNRSCSPCSSQQPKVVHIEEAGLESDDGDVLKCEVSVAGLPRIEVIAPPPTIVSPTDESQHSISSE